MPIEGGTGVAGANAVKAGGAYYEVVGKDGVSPILTKIETRVKGFRGFMQRAGSAIFAPGAGVLGAGTAGAVVGGMRLFEDLQGGIREYNRQLERTAELTAELAKARGRITAQDTERIDLIADPGEKIDALRTRIGLLQNELKGTSAEANNARKNLDDLGRIVSVSNTVDKLLGSHEGFTSEAQGRLDAAKAASAEFRDELAKARRELFLLMNPQENNKLTADIAKMIRDLQQEQRLAFMAPEHQALEKQLDELKRRNAPPEELDRIRDESRRLEDQRKGVAFTQDYHDLLNRLSNDVKFKGLDSNERAIAEMQDRARLEHQAFDIRPFQERLDRLNQGAREVRVSTRANVQTFGYGDTAMKMLTIQEKIAQNTEPDRLGQALASELRLR